MKKLRLFIPRLMDAAQLNAQNNNARMLLRYWELQDAQVTTLTYGEPDTQIAANPGIRVMRLWRRRAWLLHLFLRYFSTYDLVFYPGVHAADVAGLRWRRRLGFRAPVIATLEGLVGDAPRERFYSAVAGHPVYCQRVDARALKRVDSVLESADHVIAISPFLARMGRARYGDKFSALPLGVDCTTYHPATSRPSNREPVVVSAGRVAPHKRPELFLTLAERFPRAQFRWFGEGEQRSALIAEAAARKLDNLAFSGSLHPKELATEFRRADLFILPSYSEGVPKVTQEAAACGLPIVLFGFYEAPTVVDGKNGRVVWNDDDLISAVSEMLAERPGMEAMGYTSAEMAKDWTWPKVVRLWEDGVARVGSEGMKH